MRLARRIGLVLAALCLLGAAGAAAVLWRDGYRLYVVHTGSMAPALVPGDVVIDRRAGGPYRRGEVITFRHSSTATDVVTHRIVSVTPAGIHTKGDANATADAWTIPLDFVRGRQVGHLEHLGYLLVFLEQPAGLASLATGSITMALLWALFFPGAPAPRRPSPRHAARLVDARM